MSWRFEHELRKLQAAQDKRRATCRKLILEARRQKKNEEEVDCIWNEASTDDGILGDEIDSLVTDELTNKAERYFLPVPPRDDKRYWRESYIPESGTYLTAEGVTFLRDAIREEEKKRRESRLAVLDATAKIVGMLIGLIGVCIGLASILWK
jgi:hypothetical protein